MCLCVCGYVCDARENLTFGLKINVVEDSRRLNGKSINFELGSWTPLGLQNNLKQFGTLCQLNSGIRVLTTWSSARWERADQRVA